MISDTNNTLCEGCYKPSHRKHSEKVRKERLFATVLLIYPIVMYLIFGIYVYISSFLLNFQQMDYLGNKTFLPFSDLFHNFKEYINMAFGDGTLLSISLVNSVKVWLICFFVSNPLYLIVSYFIFKKVLGYRFVQTVVMLPEIISGLIFCLVFKQILNGPLIEIMEILGVENFPNLLSTTEHVLAVVIFYRIWVSFGSSCIFYSNAMNAISPEIIESAMVDGVSNMFQELIFIIYPLIFPTFKTLLIIGLTTMFTSDSGLVTFFMYGAPAEAYNLGYFNTVKIFNASSAGYPVIAAGGWMLTVILTPAILSFKKFLDKVDPTE